MNTRNLSPVARAMHAGKFRRYLLGYVAGIVYHDGYEWLLTKGGGRSDTHAQHGDPKSSHVWKTKEQALAVARKADSAKFPAFVRGYVYETPNPDNARGLEELTEGREWMAREFITPQPATV